ncbi:NADH-quinone oxidoreductase subunit J [Nonomuraea sp. NPDC049309]|uniref:NADH-quinone oxidoreductase subunit J n=1 Tax=Nonomuraea sp. NPDC049309 TaxID=3364350 RepID=UPI003722093B
MTEAVPSYLSPTGQEIVFLLLGAVAVGSALLVVMTRQIVHAALWLVVCFGALAGGYLVLTAEFVAWVQVLIYVGAIIVLLLFGLMLTRAPIGRSADLDSGNKVVAAVVAVATAAILVTVVIDGFRTAYTPLTPGSGAAGELGAGIFATWVLPFEALSVLLLAALIGAIVLSRTDIRGPVPASGGISGERPDGGASGTARLNPHSTPPPGEPPAASPPDQVASPPGEAGPPRGQAASPRAEAASPPDQVASPPGEAGSPRGQAASPRAEAASPPAQIASSPDQAASRPGQAASPPDGSAEPSSADGTAGGASPDQTRSQPPDETGRQ